MGLVVLAGAIHSPGLADTGSASDPDDPGSQMALDVAEVAHGHRRQGGARLLTHEVRFHGTVDSDAFHQEFGGVEVYFDVNRTRPGDERVVRFERNPDGSLRAGLFSSGGRLRGFVNWWRPDESTLQVELPRRLLKRGLTAYAWRVVATQDAPCEPGGDEPPPGEGCRDESDRLRHRV